MRRSYAAKSATRKDETSPSPSARCIQRGLRALELREQAAVERGLKNGAGLGGARQLGVDHLIARAPSLAARRPPAAASPHEPESRDVQAARGPHRRG